MSKNTKSFASVCNSGLRNNKALTKNNITIRVYPKGVYYNNYGVQKIRADLKTETIYLSIFSDPDDEGLTLGDLETECKKAGFKNINQIKNVKYKNLTMSYFEFYDNPGFVAILKEEPEIYAD